MNSLRRKFIILIITFLATTIAFHAQGSSSKKRRGTTVNTNSFEISNIESKRLENDKSGLIYYSFKARIRNRTKRTLKASFTFHAIDRDGYELEDVYLYDQVIKRNSTRILSDRQLMQRNDYDDIWEWKVVKVRLEK